MESIEPNNFERQVKNKMDELKIRPAESAWLNIEKRISNKGKQRKILFILFFLALFILTGGYWLFNSGKGLKTIAKNQLEHVSRVDDQKVKVENKDSTIAQSVISDKQSITKIESKVPERKVGFAEKIVKFKKPKDSKNLNSVPFKLSNSNIIDSEVESKLLPSAEVITHNEKHRDSADDQKKTLAKNDFEISTQLEKFSSEKIGQDTLENKVEPEKAMVKPDSVLANNKSQSHIIKNKISKWQVGFTFSGGTSLIGNNPFGLKNNYQSFLYPMYSGPGTGTISYSTLSKLKSSVAFIGGVFIEKNISRKAIVSFGINYKYFSALNKTSDSVGSGQTVYYAGPVSRNYRNSFHFLEVPVDLKVLLNNNKLLPLHWQVGMSVSQLIRSNALQFKANPRVYYIDNSLFNKTQLGFSTGLSMTLFSKQKNPLNIGPYIYYGVSGIAQEGLYKKKHFSYMGISAEILFRKK